MVYHHWPCDACEASTFHPDVRDVLNQFAAQVWGNPQAVLRRHEPLDFEYIDLGEYFQAFKTIFTGILAYDKILVRDEYRVAIEALGTDYYHRGACVLGQPGIGKTLFLIYALVHFLGQKQPVALHVRDDHYVLFKDVATLHPLSDDEPLRGHALVWALCDSNFSVRIPPPVFLGNPGSIRVIQTTEPEFSRWKGWSLLYHTKTYLMDVCSDKEIVNFATLQGFDTERMTTLASKWGNIPRTLVDLMDAGDREIEYRYRDEAAASIMRCAAILNHGVWFNFPDDVPTSFFFLRPKRKESGALVRTLADIYVPTGTLCRFLAEALPYKSHPMKIGFYRALNGYKYTRQAGSLIFETWFHSFMSAGRKLQCKWLARSARNLPTVLQARPRTDGPIPAQNANVSQIVPYYWIAPDSDFPGIQSALVLESGIFAFQMVTCRDPEPPIKGIRTLHDMLPSALKNLPFRVIFVCAQEYWAECAAKAWGVKVFFPTRETCVPVGLSVMDPARKDVAYEGYRGKPDVLMEVAE